MSDHGVHYRDIIIQAQRQRIYAAVFCMFLGLIMLSSLVIAFSSSGPIILGTEMNTNGMVEYMCLGNGCENVSQFSWHDK